MMSPNGLNLPSQRIARFEPEAPVPARERPSLTVLGQSARLATREFDCEILDSNELALRLKVKESWVIEQSKRSRTSDPIPVFRLGKHRRYRWGSPEMNDWLGRRAGYTTQRRAGAR
jgi:hypothetical protein